MLRGNETLGTITKRQIGKGPRGEVKREKRRRGDGVREISNIGGNGRYNEVRGKGKKQEREKGERGKGESELGRL